MSYQDMDPRVKDCDGSPVIHVIYLPIYIRLTPWYGDSDIIANVYLP